MPTVTREVRLEGLGVVRIERINGAKLNRALAITRAIGKKVPDLVGKVSRFRKEYGEQNALELDRATAVMRFGPRTVVDEDGTEHRVPGRLDHMTEEDWQGSGQKVRMPLEPSPGEVIAAVYDDVIEHAEDSVYRLLALLTLPNEEVLAAWKGDGLPKLIEDRVADLMGAYAEELLELAIVAGEALGDQWTTKRTELGGRVGNALRLFGLNPERMTPSTPSTDSTPTTSPENSTPTSYTDSPASTTGDPTSSSEPLPTFSPGSVNGHEPTTNGQPSSTDTEAWTTATEPALP
jgi:hypothetical protein